MKICCGFTLSVGLLLIMAVSAQAKVEVTDKFHKEIEVGNLDGINIQTTNGSITITGYEQEKLVIDADISVKGKKLEVCQSLIDKVTIYVQEDDGVLEIDTKYRKKKGYKISISFRLDTPNWMKIDATSINGSISVSDITRSVEVSTTNGSVNCRGVTGGIEAHTLNGSVNFMSVAGNLIAATVNGNVSCESVVVMPSTIEFATVNGSISLELGAVPDANIEAQTFNGRINLAGLPDIVISERPIKSFEAVLGDGTGDYEFTTINGNINLVISKGE